MNNISICSTKIAFAFIYNNDLSLITTYKRMCELLIQFFNLFPNLIITAPTSHHYNINYILVEFTAQIAHRLQVIESHKNSYESRSTNPPPLPPPTTPTDNLHFNSLRQTFNQGDVHSLSRGGLAAAAWPLPNLRRCS